MFALVRFPLAERFPVYRSRNAVGFDAASAASAVHEFRHYPRTYKRHRRTNASNPPLAGQDFGLTVTSVFCTQPAVRESTMDSRCTSHMRRRAGGCGWRFESYRPHSGDPRFVTRGSTEMSCGLSTRPVTGQLGHAVLLHRRQRRLNDQRRRGARLRNRGHPIWRTGAGHRRPAAPLDECALRTPVGLLERREGCSDGSAHQALTCAGRTSQSRSMTGSREPPATRRLTAASISAALAR